MVDSSSTLSMRHQGWIRDLLHLPSTLQLASAQTFSLPRRYKSFAFTAKQFPVGERFMHQRVTAVDGQYQIRIYSLRPIAYGEEITFDYNSITESKEEYEASVCLCGNHVCRGSYLNLAGEGAFEKSPVLAKCAPARVRSTLALPASPKQDLKFRLICSRCFLL